MENVVCQGSTDVCGVCDGDNSSCQGCPDETACNFDESSIIDDGSCIYPEANFDCAGNCLIEIDCNGICGGDSTLDECGNCDSNPFNDCLQKIVMVIEEETHILIIVVTALVEAQESNRV